MTIRQYFMNQYFLNAPQDDARKNVDQAHDASAVIDLVTCAKGGDGQAWDALVERYAPLIWSICRNYRLGRADAEDVGQSVWLRLVDQLANIRDPAALPGWLATTTQRECSRVMRATHGPRAAVCTARQRPHNVRARQLPIAGLRVPARKAPVTRDVAASLPFCRRLRSRPAWRKEGRVSRTCAGASRRRRVR